MDAFDLEDVIEEEKQIDDQIKGHTEVLANFEAEIEQVSVFLKSCLDMKLQD